MHSLSRPFKIHRTQSFVHVGITSLAEEVLDLVLQFCSHIELCALRQTGSLLNRYGSKDELWRVLFLRSDVLDQCEIEYAMQAFGLSSFSQLFETTFKLQLPRGIIGFWRAESTSDHVNPGELLSITAMNGGLLCSTVEGDGTKRELFRAVVKSQPKSGVRVLFFKLDHELSPLALPSKRGVTGAAKVGLKRNRLGFTLTRAGIPQQYIRVEQPDPACPLLSEDSDNGVLSPNSLWSAYYGSHCKEIVQISLIPGSLTNEDVNSSSDQRTNMMLCGTKIVGDPNVPAGRQSFIVDTARRYDIVSELSRASSGLTVSFVSGRAQVVDLNLRSPSIIQWLKGKGQLNVASENWAPVWVELDCLIYRSNSGINFSVLWQEPVHGVNIVIDFSPLPFEKTHSWIP